MLSCRKTETARRTRHRGNGNENDEGEPPKCFRLTVSSERQGQTRRSAGNHGIGDLGSRDTYSKIPHRRFADGGSLSI